MTRLRTRSAATPTAISYTVIFEGGTPLTVAASSVSVLVAAILDRARQQYGTTRPLYAVIEPDGRRGYLWSGRHVVDAFTVRVGGAR